MKLSKDKSSLIVNDSLTLAGIPPETFNYKLGNRSALDWIIDQYQVYTDPRTQITSDPNAWGEEHNNPEYIPQLLAKIITVSLETQKTVQAFTSRDSLRCNAKMADSLSFVRSYFWLQACKENFGGSKDIVEDKSEGSETMT